jgi:hypothetical protein
MPAFFLGAWMWLKSAFGVIAEAAKSFFKSLDGQGWVGLIAALVLTFLWLRAEGESRHWHKQSDRFESLHKAEVANEAKIAKQAVDLKTRVDALTSSITSTLKERSDAENARIAADADAVRLRGPGKAVCPGGPGAAGTPVRSGQTAAAATDAGSQVPSGNWARVPWDWLVILTQEHDQMRTDLQAIEDQHAQLEKAWPKGTAK